MAQDVDSSRRHTAEEERRIREATLDETLAQWFPASDPLSTDPIPTTRALSNRQRDR